MTAQGNIRGYIILISGMLCLAAIAAAPAPLLLFVPSSTAPTISEVSAVRLAREYSGLNSQPVTSAQSGILTDNTIPFHPIVNRPAWQISFAHVTILCRRWQKAPEPNMHLTSLIVWLDAVDGSLLKAVSRVETDRCLQDISGRMLLMASPNPQVLGLTNMTVEDIEHMATGTERFAHSAEMPTLPLQRVLGASGVTTDTTELDGYFGLFSDTRDPDHSILNRAGWLLVYNGVTTFVWGPIGRPGPDSLPGEELVVLDAQTSKNIFGTMQRGCPASVYPLAAYYDASSPTGQMHFFLYNGDTQPLHIEKVWLNRNTGEGAHPAVPAQATPSAIPPGMVGEVTVNLPTPLADPRQVDYPLPNGLTAGFTLPKSPLPVALTNPAFTADPHVFSVTCNNVSPQPITLTGVEVFPITNKVAALAPAALLLLKPGEEQRITVTLKVPPARGSYIWCAALVEQCQVGG